jgi:hypothetical protein
VERELSWLASGQQQQGEQRTLPGIFFTRAATAALQCWHTCVTSISTCMHTSHVARSGNILVCRPCMDWSRVLQCAEMLLVVPAGIPYC